MSYGVLVSKTGSLLVETTSGLGGVTTDEALDRFQTIWGAVWVPGRLTLTRLHLTFMPDRVGRGAAMLKVNLRDVVDVGVHGGLVNKAVSLRTPRHVARLRCSGATGLSTQLEQLVEEAKASAPGALG